MAELDPTVIKRTQETLGKYVKKPSLTEKLLKKPPFRFLHDIFNAVIKDTGCFKGLYTSEELNSENIKDRDDKMRFLQKMIDVIKITTNSTINVRTSKIVAGQESEKTNELLQLIGEVIEKKLDWQSAVETVGNGGDNGQGKEAKESVPTKAKTLEKQKESKSKDKPKERPKVVGNKTKEETKSKETKNSIKTISPTVKSDKTKIGKATKDNAGKENRDKAKVAPKKTKEIAEKIKISSKSKTDTKGKSPSPTVKNDNVTALKEEQKTSLEDFINNELKNTVEINSKSAAASTPIKKSSSMERRNSKNGAEIIPTTTAATTILEASSPPPKELEKIKEPESRKHSAQQRKGSGSSGKKRRSSANKLLREEHGESTQQQPSLYNIDNSLNMNNEEVTTKVVEAIKKAVVALPPAATEIPPAAIPTNSVNEVKRESTFTRENSKDSTMSSSNNRPRTSLRPPSARPPSARPGAPRRRDKNVEIVLQPNDQVKLTNGINVKLEVFGDLDDDGENLVIIEDANTDNIKGLNEEQESSNTATTNIKDNLEQQGHLVQQILETQKELGGDVTNGKYEKDNNGLNTRQSSARQMNNLRDVIQNLTKSVNPFGKLMDFIPEDIDAMQLEMTMWRDSYTQAAHELKREKSLTESATEPMKNQLVQIESSIKEYLEMIDSSRTKVLQNSEKILKMLTEQ